MDPTISLCRLYSSFSSSSPNYVPLEPIKIDYSVEIQPSIISGKDIPEIQNYNLVSKELIEKLAKIDKKNKEKELDFGILRKKSNPFEQIKDSIFLNRSAVKLANLDAIFNLTNSTFGLLSAVPIEQSQNFIFCDLASAPGGFTQYIQYRKAQSIGFGLSLKSEYGGLNWSERIIEMDGINKFNVEWGDSKYGGDNTGNLYTNSIPFSKKVLAYHPNGVDLVVADGGFQVERTEISREIILFRLILNEIIIGIKVLKTTGNFACKIFRTLSPIMVQLLYITATCFEEFYIIKPVSTRPISSEKFIIGKGLRRGKIDKQIKLLERVNKEFDKKAVKYVNQIIDFEKLPKSFIEQMRKINDYTIDNTIKQARDIGKLARNKKINLEKYNISRFSLIWDIPSYNENKTLGSIKI